MMRALLATVTLAVAAPHAALAADDTALFTAAKQCDDAGVEAALAAGTDVNALDEGGQNAISHAFFCPATTRLLLARGADPNGGSYPAVIQAANNYSVEVLQLLLDGGADPNKTGTLDPGAHLRTLAAAERAKGKKANTAMIQAWESAAASLPKSEVNALQQAVQQTNCHTCVRLLLDHGADVRAAEADGNLLHRLATFSMTAEGRRDAFAKGKDAVGAYGFKMPDWYGDLPAEHNGTPSQMLELLVGAGLDVNAKRADGLTPFHVALRLHKLDLAKGMLRAGADARSQLVPQGPGRTVTTWPIVAAAEFADPELMQLILDQGPDLDVSVETIALGVTMNTDYKGNTNWGGDGYTALIVAIMSGHTDVARMLLDAGASIHLGSSGISILDTPFGLLKCLVTIKNKTPIYWAVERDDLALVERIAQMMSWKFNPDFTIKQYDSGVSFMGMKCMNFKSKQSPSLYATTIGNLKAAKLLADKGM